MNIYVGNLSYDITGEELQGAFEAHGHVDTVKVIRDKYTGQSKGFAFVIMPNQKEADAAILGITEIKGRRVTLSEARPQVRYDDGPGQRERSRDRDHGRRRWDN